MRKLPTKKIERKKQSEDGVRTGESLRKVLRGVQFICWALSLSLSLSLTHFVFICFPNQPTFYHILCFSRSLSLSLSLRVSFRLRSIGLHGKNDFSVSNKLEFTFFYR